MCLESTVCSTSQSVARAAVVHPLVHSAISNAVLWLYMCHSIMCTAKEEDVAKAHSMFYRYHLKKHAQDGLTAMNCNHWQNTETINKQIGFLEASSVPVLGQADPCRCGAQFSPERLGGEAQLHLLFIYADFLCACLLVSENVSLYIYTVLKKGLSPPI